MIRRSFGTRVDVIPPSTIFSNYHSCVDSISPFACRKYEAHQSNTTTSFKEDGRSKTLRTEKTIHPCR